MELVEGISLRDLLRAQGATAPEAALVVLKGSLLGLAAAHEAGVVHRDYKPENVLVTPQGESKLVDFGIAARSGDTGAAAGTPLYMAPEQFAGQPAQPATDVYAATITFFECVTGSRPYTGTTVNELMIQHTQSPIPDELAPEHVRSLIRGGLAKSPQDRPASAAALVEALEDVARAGYGEDWEERGQRKLVTLVAMLPLLLLGSAPDIPSATTSLAETDLGSGSGSGSGSPPSTSKPSKPSRRHKPRLSSRAVKALIGTIAAGGVIGAVAAVAAATGNGNNDAGPGTIAAGYGATSGATTSVAPTQNSGLQPPASGPSATATHGPSSSPSASSSASSASSSTSPSAAAAQTTTPSGTSTTSPASGGPTPTPPSSSPTSIVTAPSTPAASTSSAAPPPPTLHVSSVSIKSLGCSGFYSAAATVDVQSDGAAAGTLYLAWSYTDPNGAVHSAGTDSVTIPAGQTEFLNSTPYYHNFGSSSDVYWILTVSTNPAAAQGDNSSVNLFATSCEIQ
jgi:serine/threonine protein kinase